MSPFPIDPRPLDEIAAEIARLATAIEAETVRSLPGASLDEQIFARRITRAIGSMPFADRSLLALDSVIGIVMAAAASETEGETWHPAGACDSARGPEFWISTPRYSARGAALLALAEQMRRYLDLRRLLAARLEARNFLQAL